MGTTNFDPVKFKESSRREWQKVAQGWHQWMPRFAEWCAPVSRQMLELASIGPGSRVLDIAAGDGDQSIQAARRVGPNGYVLATDISSNMLEFAAESARKAGLTQMETRVMDAECLELDDASFDSVISRFALMLLPNVEKAVAEIHRVLKPGGRIAAIVFSTPDKTPWLAVPASIARQRASLPPPQPEQPGLFRLGFPGVFASALRDAGFGDIATHRVSLPFRMESAAECARFLWDVAGAIHEMLAPLSEEARRQTWGEIEAALRRYEGPEGFESPCEVIVGCGVKGSIK